MTGVEKVNNEAPREVEKVKKEAPRGVEKVKTGTWSDRRRTIKGHREEVLPYQEVLSTLTVKGAAH